MTDLEASAEAIAEAVAETLETQPQPETREQENAAEAAKIVDEARAKTRKKREKKNLSKSQRNQVRLLRGCTSVSVVFNGIPVRITRGSAITLVEMKKAKVNASLIDGEDLRVSLDAIVEEKPAS